ncbi:MAG: hypothetical protein WBG90_18540, partial [Saonia sp.]
MKNYLKPVLYALPLLFIFSCEKIDDFIGGDDDGPDSPGLDVNFKFRTTIKIGGEASAEISAFDPSTNKIFVVNNDDDLNLNEISVFDITDIDSPVQLSS